MAKKLSRGRQKVELKTIVSMEDRLVTFSKRRSGLYKKASEISTLCGVEIGILVFSPSGNAFTFGVPNLQQVAARLLQLRTTTSDDPIQADGNNAAAAVVQNNNIINIAVMEEMNASYNELSSRLYRLRKEAEVLARRKREIQELCWWEVDIEDLNKKEVDQLTATMEELKRTADERLRNMVNTAAAPPASSSSSSSPDPGSPSDSMMSIGSSQSSSSNDDDDDDNIPPTPISTTGAGTSKAVPDHEEMAQE
ncbi:Agamous-like MADS-box protein AGL61-like protein [Drosera capensis]